MEFKVVLLCFKPYMNPCQVTEQTLRSLFEQSDGLVNLSIFQRQGVVKAFVEFENSAATQRVISKFANQNFNIGSVRVYPSKKQSVRATAGKAKARTYDNFEKNSPNDNVLTSQKSSRLVDTAPLGTLSGLSEDQHRLIIKPKILLATDFDSKSKLHYSQQSRSSPVFCKSNSDVDQRYRSNLNLAITTESLKPNNLKAPKRPDGLSSHRFAIHLKNINFKIINNKILMNLLCCFGNLNQIYVNYFSAMAIAVFESQTEAGTAIFYLNNQFFFGYPLQAEPFNVDCLGANFADSSNSGFEVLEIPSQVNRYKQTLNIKFNAPSALLHFTNLSPNCTPPLLFEIIRAIQEPVKIMRLCKKTSNSSTMMLVQFDSLHKSIEVLSVLHNKMIDNLPIRISFSQSKIK